MFYFGLLLTEILWRDNSLQFSAKLTECSLFKQTFLYLNTKLYTVSIIYLLALLTTSKRTKQLSAMLGVDGQQCCVRLHGSGQIFERMTFYSVQPVYTEPCNFSYKLQYCLPFKNLHGSMDPLLTKGGSVQVFVRSENLSGSSAHCTVTSALQCDKKL